MAPDQTFQVECPGCHDKIDVILTLGKPETRNGQITVKVTGDFVKLDQHLAHELAAAARRYG